MYLNPFNVKEHNKNQDGILGIQLKGWVYESHAWVVVSEDKQDHKLCRWCGAESTTDMVCNDPDKLLCPDNPIVKAMVESASMVALGEEGNDA